MDTHPIRNLLTAIAALFLLGVTGLAHAQDAAQPPEHHHPAAPDPDNGAWTWSADANAIAGYNYQQRQFADFWAYESQNWGMLSGERAVGRGRLSVEGMISLEPWTVGHFVYAHGVSGPQRVYAFDDQGRERPFGGSPQVFQTGESYLGVPLINIQHPHDLLMGLGATYRFAGAGMNYIVGADFVGAAALGPTPFMHRESARDNPSAPLTHHYLDSTHITPGVLRAGVEAGPLLFETSVFRGEEPDDNRTNIERPGIDSWSARTTWRRGPWEAQFSGGHLHQPEWFEPTDVTRLTASVAFTGAVAGRPLAATVAWGQNRELGFTLDGYLAEWDLRVSSAHSVYGRAESVLKEIFGLGVHPAGLLNHPRNFSQINALTAGYVRDLPFTDAQRFGVGADVTLYRASADLVEYFGSPHSYHLFLRWRPARTATDHAHMH